MSEERKCAFMDRECTSDCVAYVGSAEEFHFPCSRLDAMYEIAWSLTDFRKKGLSVDAAVDAHVEMDK